MGIGKTLSDILKEKDINVNELANKIEVSPSTIYSIIQRDNTKVDITVLARICTELNVSMERFYIDYIDSDKNAKKNPPLTAEEKMILESYRNFNADGKNYLIKQVKTMSASGLYNDVLEFAARSRNGTIELVTDINDTEVPPPDTI